jgi:predicted nicotinamide N-methyase
LTDRASFIRANTRILPPPLVPEIALHLAHEALAIWTKTEEELGELGLPPPFWAFAWAGGQALARHVLDHSSLVAGKRVLDLASGSGLVAIAAAKAGADHVQASDIDLFAIEVIRLNAARNDVVIDIVSDDLLEGEPPETDVILAGDVFYERELAARAHRWLRLAEAKGIDVLIGDPGRSYLPQDALEAIASYQVPVTRDLEDQEIKHTRVWRLA